MKSGRSSRGFTLLETLVAVVLIGTVALAAVPLLSSQNPTKLDVAAAEVGNSLRFAIGEAERIGGYIWLDGSVSGHLKVSQVVSSTSLVAVTDPLTKRALDVDTSGPAFSGQISIAPKFFYGGTAYTQLLITGAGVVGPGTGTQLYVYDSSTSPSTPKGPLQANSGVVLTLGPQTATVALNETTGLVTLP